MKNGKHEKIVKNVDNGVRKFFEYSSDFHHLKTFVILSKIWKTFCPSTFLKTF